MFWKHNNTSSPKFEAVLNKKGVTLQELMDEDEIIQECKSQNKKLIEFLCQGSVLEELVTLITDEPSEELDEKSRFKYPKIACELLTCDVPTLNECLSRDNALLEKLYSFMDKEPPLNPLLASFLSRTLSVLIVKRIDQHWISYQVTCLQAMGFLKDKENFINLLLKHLGTSAIMDLTLKLITEVGDVEHRQNLLNWLDSQRLVQSLVELFHPKVDSERQHNASQLLCDVLRISRDTLNDQRKRMETDPILTRLEAPETATLLMEQMLGEDKSDSSIFGGIQVLLALLGHKNSPFVTRWQVQDSFIDNNFMYNNDNDEVEVERKQKVAQSTALVILNRLKDFHQILLDPPKKTALNTSIGILDPPLGNIRLQVTKLLAALIATDNSEVLREIISLGTVEVLLDLFFTYVWNNFLHAQVQQCVNSALTAHVKPNESESEENSDNLMYPYLFIKCRLLDRVLDAWDDNEQKQTKPKGIRQGYMGHLINIANDIVQQCQSNSALENFIMENVSKDTLENWKKFVATSLNETNMVQQVVLGGFHPAFLSNEEIDDAMYQNDFFQIYSDLQMPEMPPEIIEKIGMPGLEMAYPDESVEAQANRAINAVVNEGDLSRQAELFRRVCSEYINTIDDADDTIFEESAQGMRTGKLPPDDSWDPRGGNNSDEDDPPQVVEQTEINVDPWLALEVPQIEPSVSESNDPWTTLNANDPSQVGQDGWADFGSFATTFEPNNAESNSSTGDDLHSAGDQNNTTPPTVISPAKSRDSVDSSLGLQQLVISGLQSMEQSDTHDIATETKSDVETTTETASCVISDVASSTEKETEPDPNPAPEA